MQQSLFGQLAAAYPSTPDRSHHGVLSDVLLENAVFTVMDLETTGLSARQNSITEITAIQFQNGKELGKYSTLVKPLEPIPEEVELLTGITNALVRNAPVMVMAISELSGFMGTAPLIVGHNVPFDIGFLVEKVNQNGLNSFSSRYDLTRAFCTRMLAKKALPGLPSYEGIVVATAVGYHNPNPHRAEADVRMSAAILFGIIERLREAKPEFRTVQDLLDYQGILT